MFLYWIYDDECEAIATDGYVGITKNPTERLKAHRKTFGAHVSMLLLFEGSEDECKTKERDLRPSYRIGWNIAVGGGKPPSPLGRPNPGVSRALKGKKRPIEVKIKCSESQKGKPKNPESIEKMRASRRGQSPWNKGKPMRSNTKEKLSEIFSGKSIEWEKKTCHCGITCNAGTYARWHGDRCKTIGGRR